MPIATDTLQKLVGRYYGKLGGDATEADRAAYDHSVQGLIDEIGPPNPAQYETLLNHATTKRAINQGDVPYFMRTGNDLYAEDGTLLVTGFEHPRLETVGNISAGISTRVGEEGRAEGVEALTAYLPAVMAGAQQRILNNAEMARALHG